MVVELHFYVNEFLRNCRDKSTAERVLSVINLQQLTKVFSTEKNVLCVIACVDCGFFEEDLIELINFGYWFLYNLFKRMEWNS